ncbi:MAG: formylmethanofuran dehydrogenase subunit C [Betaproteobacteria bacterium]|nr:formylmethanofuran dehydrogenase subunit C [Betaproteobacteria bacterium]MDE2123457.1 formylmethanofuran dehydrogenase subunit C [Betaproteobacteria bacterium]MDE2185452.1 formylmethanofuran dehydrogenase subunit C [Betaproteobacteria bacterium]MDE2323242.1 formylmethanofuran dehydrogenase subunit C [Betaproteobacteria bacterium]
MSLVLTLREQSPAPDDLRGLTPRLLGALTPSEAARQPLSPRPGAGDIGTLFKVSDNGNAHPDLLIVRTGARRLDGLGRNLDGGCLRIEGHAGAALGQDLQAGEIVVDGDCGDFAGCGMRGGLIRVLGDAGHCLAAALHDTRQGMAGGTLVVHGRAGDRAGHRMRRGLVLVGEGCGAACGAGMLAGTLVTPRCGPLPGLGLRRGSLLLRQAPEFPITYNACGAVDLTWLRLLARAAAAWLPGLLPLHGLAQRHCGDLACGGKGEILVLAP